jgi:predicted signal transduction protein with EAL and GGDEF domain
VAGITDVDGVPVEVSASVGVAYLPAEAPAGAITTDALVRSADEAMYRAKKAARGQLRLVEWSADAANVPEPHPSQAQGEPTSRGRVATG